MPKLKPCPFCGNEDLFLEDEPELDGKNHYYDIVCNNKKCYLSNGAGRFFEDKEEIIKLWNKRS